MKKHFLFPVLAVMFAVTGAYASNRLAITYYNPTDTSCEVPIADKCTPGTEQFCLAPNTQPYRYSDPDNSVSCEQLRWDSQK